MVQNRDEFLDGLIGPEKDEMTRIIRGNTSKAAYVCDRAEELANQNDFELKAFIMETTTNQDDDNTTVKIAIIQNSINCETTGPVEEQKKALFKRMRTLVEAAYLCGAKIVCLQEAWNSPFFVCLREKRKWLEFAEDIETGETTCFIKDLCVKYNIVIVSPVFERDSRHLGVVWNTAVVVNEKGEVLGFHRKNHIPRVGDFNESTYYTEGDTGHPVFETSFARIAINICYGRHHPLNWLAFAMNGAEIIFNPCATVAGLSENGWDLEARTAALNNNVFVGAINRVGTETFQKENNPSENFTFGPFYGSSYLAGPDGSRTPCLSRNRNGVLICQIRKSDINQTRDHWMFQATARYPIYANLLNNYIKIDYNKQIVHQKSHS